jgi:predicted methyltransferase
MKKPLNKILNKIDLSLDDFKKICEKFTNKKIFKTDQGGNITYDDKGNLIRKI